jgi:hypothetical protein
MKFGGDFLVLGKKSPIKGGGGGLKTVIFCVKALE